MLRVRLMHSLASTAAAAALLFAALSCTSSATERLSATDRRAAAGAAAFERGAFHAAVEDLRAASEAYRRKHQSPELIDTLTQLGGVYHALGQHRLALGAVNEAVELARETQDRPRLARALSSLGAIQSFAREADSAEATLREALAVARKTGDPLVRAGALNNLGNLLAAQEKYEPARAAYREAASLAGAGELGAKARTNLAQTAVAAGDFTQVPALNHAAIKSAQALPDSHDKAFALLRAGKTWELLFETAPDHPQARRADALRAYEKAAHAAEAVDDERSLSFALGYAGHLYEQEKKWREAERLTSRASFLAQSLHSPDVLYRWEWQTGRIARAQGRQDDAIAACQRAVTLLNSIRTDLSVRLGNSNAQSSFREVAGGAYFDLADFLLQRADGQTGDEYPRISHSRAGYL